MSYSITYDTGYSVWHVPAVWCLVTVITRFSCQEARCALYYKLQHKGCQISPLDGLARSKQDSINRGHGAQYLYRPPPAGAQIASTLVTVICETLKGDIV